MIIGETIQKETLRKSSRPMIDKLSWKGEIIQFELCEIISTQTNSHHYKCEVKVTSMSLSFDGTQNSKNGSYMYST